MKQGRFKGWEIHLITEAQRGNKIAFELLADEYRATLFAVAQKMLRNSEDASDAVQDSLLKAYRGLHSFEPGRPVLPWLCRIVHNSCLDQIRQRKFATEPLSAHEHCLVGPSNDPIDWEAKAMRDAIRRLPLLYRSILELRIYQDMEVNEIADSLGKPEGTVKSWLFRARTLLKKELTANAI